MSEKRMIKVDGVDVEFGSETHVGLLNKRLDSVAGERDAEKARADGLENKLGETQAKLDSTTTELAAAQKAGSPEVIEAKVAEHLTFRADALKVLPADYDFTGKSSKQVKVDMLKKLSPETEVREDASDSWLDGYLSAARKQEKPDYTPPKDVGERQDAGEIPDMPTFYARQSADALKR